MLEKKIVEFLHNTNIEFLDIKKFEENYTFYDFFKSIMRSAHIFIKIAYKILIIFFVFFFIITKIFLIPKKIELNLFKYLVNLLSKIYLFKDILKFIKTYSIIYNYD